LACGGENHLREPVHAPRSLAVDPLRRIELLQLAGEMDAVVGVIEGLDLGGARLAGEQPLPGRLHVVAEWADHSEPGDDDASSHYIPSPPSTSSTSPVMNDAWSDARKRTAPATSSGSATRPSGVCSTIAAVAP